MPEARPPSPDTRLQETRAFFGPRAAGWEERFPDDGPAYDAAVAAVAPPAGGVAVDVGCGTGRALVPLRRAVGPAGSVIGIDVTAEMIAEAQRLRRHRAAGLVVGDALHLPVAAGRADVVFAAGLLSHLADPRAGLVELARIARPGGRLAVFHPIGRATLAARHGRQATDADALAPGPMTAALEATGWQVDDIDDGDDRYLALARRPR